MTSDPINVLLIEDNPGDATLITRMLGNSRASINVECASSLSKGREFLSKGGVDIILLDLTLPDSQGLATFTRVYQESPDIPIILLTSVEDDELAIEAAQQGAHDYLSKGQSLDIQLLMRSIRYAMERSRLKRESLEEVNRVREQAELKNAVLEERYRIARDLHDSATQSLYSLTLWAETGRRVLAEGGTDLAMEYFDQIGGLAQQSLKEMRLLVHELHPLGLDTHGFIGSIQQRLDAVESRAGVTTSLQVEGELDLPIEMRDGLYWVVQGALNNALRHAGADSVTVTIDSTSDPIELRVSDNGRGFDPSAVVGSGGLGLTSMEERLKGMGGTLIIDSHPGEGTTILIQLSVPKSLG
jgi:signal transduction histidine kinase